MKVAVIGANGQTGPVFLRRLVETCNYKPIAVCRNNVGAAMISDIGCDVRVGVISDEKDAGRLLNDCDVVVNCIWPVGLSKEIKAENEAIIDNLSRLKNLKRIIHFSSVAVYGCIYPGSTFTQPRPDSNYGKQKLALEKYVARTFQKTALDYYIIRLGHVFGPHQWLSSSIVRLANSGNFSLPFDGACPSNSIHVEELAATLVWLISAPVLSGTYNLAGTPQQTWRQIFDWHKQVCGLPSVKGMSIEDSLRLRQEYIKRSRESTFGQFAADILAWLQSLPVHQLLTSGGVRPVSSAALGIMPSFIKNRIKSANALRGVRGDIKSLAKSSITPEPWLYSDAMPGIYLEPYLTQEYFQEEGFRKQQLLEWHQAKLGPHWTSVGRRLSNEMAESAQANEL